MEVSPSYANARATRVRYPDGSDGAISTLAIPTQPFLLDG